MDDRPPLILLHAFPLDSQLFRRMPAPPGIRLHTPDLRGFGRTPLAPPGEPVPAPDMDVLAGDVIAGMDAAGIRRAIVGGVSIGGYVALALLAAHPDRVAGLVLADTRSTADSQEARERRLATAREADAGIVAPGDQAVAPLLAPGADPAVRRELAALADRADPQAVAWAQRAMAGRRDTTAALAAAGVPVLVLVGEHDALSPPAVARAMADAARRATLVIIPGAGHLTPAEAPGSFADALRDWLRVTRYV
jgi:pimeloyl-ACP methyl ester carboxylesterase